MYRKYGFLIIVFIIAINFIFLSCNKSTEEQPSKPLYELSAPDSIPAFNAKNAYDYTEAQTLVGPRNPGSIGHDKMLAYLQSELRKYADEVELEPFNYTGYDNEALRLTNIIGRFNPQSKDRILLCAHWDTRPRAEHATVEALKSKPILGANDGASGVGVLLELAQVLKQKKISYGVDIVLFDGEDYGKENDLNLFCLGSKYFAAEYYKNNYPAFGILLDMVGDKEASFAKEQNSIQYAPDVVNMIWNTASLKNASVFNQAEGSAIYDDHIPLNQAGIRTVDIIDAELVGADTPNKRRNYWHSENDTMQNISEETLQQVGDVLTYFIYSLKFNY